MTERSGRPRDADVDRRILDATLALLDEVGPDAVTIAAVAERAGVGRPTVYRRYPDAGTLLIAVLVDEGERLQAEAGDTVSDALPALDQLVGLATPYLAWHDRRPAVGRALLRESMFSGGEWQARFAVQGLGLVERVLHRLTLCRDRGELAPDADLAVLAQAWFALYLVTAIAGLQGHLPTLEARIALLRAMLAQHLDGVRPRAT